MIISAIFLFIAGMLDGFMDSLQFKPPKWIVGNGFWDPDYSWKNKWLTTDGRLQPGREKFMGSSTYFVWLTDGWHLTKWFRNWFYVLAICFAIGLPHTWIIIPYLIFGKVLHASGFVLVYRYL